MLSLPDVAQGRVNAFYSGITLMAMVAVLFGMLVRSRQQARHVAALKRQAEGLRTEAEKRQQEFLSKLRSHIEHTPLAVVELDASRRFQLWAGRAEAIFGWHAAELLGQPCDTLPWVDEPGLPALLAAFAGVPGAAMTGRVVTVRHVTRDGQARLVEWHVSVLAGSDGATESVLALGLNVTESQEAAATLRREKGRYALVVEAGSAGMWTLDPALGHLFWEQHLAQMLGHDPADFPTRINQWLEWFHPEDRTRLEAALQECQAQPAVRQTLEVRLRNHRGAYRWFRLGFSIEEAVAGLPAMITGTAVELTDLKHAEEKFRGLVEQSLAGIFILQSGRVVYANPKFWGIFRGGGTQPPDCPELLDLVFPEDRDMVEAQLRPLLAGKTREAPLLFRVMGPQGHAVAMQGHGIASEHEGEAAVLGLIMDVSHVFAQERTSRRLSQVVEQSPVAILITDPAGVIAYANPKFCEVSGYGQEELLGQKPSLLKSAQMPEEFYRDLWTRLRRGKKWEGEYVNRAKDGRNFTVRANLFPIFDESGNITHYVEIMEDITAQRSLEERLARAQRLESIGNMAGGIAHDLNNILAPVRLGAEFLKTLPFSGKEREIVEVMDISIHRASELVQQVLAFSRGRRAKREVLSPALVIGEIERLVRETFPRDVRLEVQIAPDLAMVHADATQLLQVLMNLCVNSRDAMPGGGVLRLSADNVVLSGAQTSSFPGARPGPHVRIRVSDTGMGISPEVLTKIFEPFFTTKDVGKGTGLGLSTALGIVQEHGGMIELESTGPLGSSFVMYLPVAPPVPPPSVQPPMSARLPAGEFSGAGMAVLVVDDEASLRQAISVVLSQRGYTVIEAGDGYQAIEQMKRHGDKISAVVLDVMMPRLDGVATMKALREMRPDIRVIATSGVNHDTRVEALRQLGVQQFLLKPYRNRELLEALRQCLSPKPESTQE
ncbi:MAG: PAS domain S-box protein [Opitutales bacterium]|jgi:PAS domain S-box-containing protein